MSGPLPAPRACERCGTALAPELLRCPRCGALVHARALATLAAQADVATAALHLADATRAWHQALQLLPPDAAQVPVIEARLAELGARMERGEGRAAPARGPGSRRGLWGTLLAGLAFLAAKGKLLLLALTKIGTLLPLLASLGIYWQLWGWAIGAGVLVSLYLHELGHIASLWRYGIPVSAPMFLPGFGAYVRHGHLPTARLGARVALAGPAAGLGAALAAAGVYAVTREPYWAVLAKFGAWLNLLNLAPVWILDGAKVFDPLSRAERWVVVMALLLAGVAGRDAVVSLIGIVAALVTFLRPAAGDGDRGACLLTVATVLGLGALLVLLPGAALP